MINFPFLFLVIIRLEWNLDIFLKIHIFYSIKKRNVSINVKAGNFKNCIYIEGKGESEFIADTRSGPIGVDIFIKEWICPGVGIVKQQRQEHTKASAFGNMSLEKVLINFKE